MRVLITGGYGFAGSYLARHFVECGDDVAVSHLACSNDQLLTEKILPKSIQSLVLDITNRRMVEEVVALLKPDVICNLAAITFVPDADKHPTMVYDVNVFGLINILDAVVQHCPQTRILHVSSAEVYGAPRPGSLPLTETSELRPVTIYGVTKASADLTAFKYSYRDGIDIVRVRPFPHVGPGQRDQFALSSFAKQLAEIKLRKREAVLRVGNLESRRDYTDVSDIVRGYREAVLNGKRGAAYNLCSGRSLEIGELLKKLIEIAEVDVEVQVDESRIRPNEITDMYGSYQLAQKDFGWKPRIDLEGTLHSLFAYWIEELSK